MINMRYLLLLSTLGPLFSLSWTDSKVIAYEGVGVCYGLLGNDLPSAPEVIKMFQDNGIKKMRLYDPNQPALDALRNSGIKVMVGVPNQELESLNNPDNAKNWVRNNIMRYHPSVQFEYIAVGNEVNPHSNEGQYVKDAMVNIFNAVRDEGLQDRIKVSTVVDTGLLGSSYPPSEGRFKDDVLSFIQPIIGHLAWARTPLLANIYSYFAYASNQKDISLDYALFTSPRPVVYDQGREYQNLFDAMMDAFYAALDRAGQGGLDVVIAETGWPSAGGVSTTVDNARTYITKFNEHAKHGTPRRPGPIDAYIFAMFDENQKGGPAVERHWGLFSPNKQAKYGHINFS